MALRGFGNVTVTGAAQPLFGTTTSAPVTPTPDRQTGSLSAPSSNPSYAVVPVNANIFRTGDRVFLGSSAAFGPVNSNPSPGPDGGFVQAVNPGAGTITVGGLQRNHNASEWAVLALPAAQIAIQAGADALYLGEDSSVSPTSATLIEKIGVGGQAVIGAPSVGNLIETQHLWVYGTDADTYVPYLLTI